MNRALALLLVVAMCLTGCASCGKAPTSLHHVDVMVCDASLEPFATAWRTEVGRRFPDAVVVLCHGGEFVDGQWLCKAPAFDLPCMSVHDLAAHFQHKFEGRPVVLLCCNPGHLQLHMPGVYYFSDSVWCVPDRATGDNPTMDRASLDGIEYNPPKQESRWVAEPGIGGNIFEWTD